MTNQHVYRYNT